MSRPLTAGCPARRENHREIGRGVALLLTEGRHDFARHRRALDIDRALRHPCGGGASLARAKLRPIFMMTAASASARRRISSPSGSVAGSTDEGVVAPSHRRSCDAPAPEMLETPGTIVTANRSRNRMKRCMNEP